MTGPEPVIHGFDIALRAGPAALVVELGGVLDAGCVPLLRRWLDDLLTGYGGHAVVVHIDRVGELSAAAVELLVELATPAADGRGPVRLVIGTDGSPPRPLRLSGVANDPAFARWVRDVLVPRSALD